MSSPKRRTSRVLFVTRIWVLLLVLAGAGIAWEAYRVLPSWIEKWVGNALLEEGVVLTEFPVEHIGYNQARVGRSNLLWGRHELRWESLLVGYELADLTEGTLSQVEVLRPMITLRPVPLPVYELQPGPVVPGDAFPVPDPSVPAQQPVPDPGRVAGGGAVPDRTEEQLEPGWWDLLRQVPFKRMLARAGVVDLQLHDALFRRASWKGWLEKQPFGTAGEMLLENEEMSVQVSLRAPSTIPVVTLQGMVALPEGAVRQLGNEVMRLLPQAADWPRFTETGQVMMDFLGEVDEDNRFSASAEATVDRLGLRLPDSPLVVLLSDLMVGAVYKERSLSLEAGTQVLLPPLNGLVTEPFGMRVSLTDSIRLHMETELIQLRRGDLQARCALRGQAAPLRFPGEGWMRLEGSFTGITYGELSSDPVSLLLEGIPGGLALKATPVGLHRNGSLWIEELRGAWDLATSAGEGSFQWFGLAGQPMGEVDFSIRQEQADQLCIETVMTGEGGGPRLEGKLLREANLLDVKLAGELPLAWVETLSTWQGISSLRPAGPDPLVELDLRGEFPLYKGSGSIDPRGLSLSFDGGTRIEGIHGRIEYAINVLPMTTRWQEMKIDAVRNGTFEMRDITLEWELPSIRHLVVRKLEGAVGSGRISLDPFIVDPFNPAIRTGLNLHHLEADLLRRWLGENRFSMEGHISGNLSLGWKNGQLVLGQGRFRLDEGATSGRFRFLDQAFLKEKFAAFGGVPVELKDRLLEALLRNGIRIDTLEMTLGPAREDGMLLLRIALSGESSSEMLQVPVRGFVINNLISLEDLADLLGLVAPIRVDTQSVD